MTLITITMTAERIIQLTFDGIIGIFAVVGMVGTGLALPLLLAESHPTSDSKPDFHIIEVKINRL